MRLDEPRQPHLLAFSDPTGNLAAWRVDHERAGLDRERLSAIADFSRAHPDATARAISRALGNVSRLQVKHALRAIV